MNLRDRSSYIDKVNKMTLRELRLEISDLNKELVLININEAEFTFEDVNQMLASCAIHLTNFFLFDNMTLDLTFNEHKERNNIK